MKRALRRCSATTTFATWLVASVFSPLVTLHVTFEHPEHAPIDSSAHHGEDEDADHDGSDHQHPQIAAGLAQPPARLEAVTASAALAAQLWSSAPTPPRPSSPGRLDGASRSSPSLSRSCVLLL